MRHFRWLPVWQRIELTGRPGTVQGTEQLVTAAPDGRLPTHHNHWPRDDSDRPTLLRVTFLEPAQVWAIDPSLLLVHVCGTIYQFICEILS